ncbi:MAG: tRNA1(Val) A37 N6-methylase TrmN6 [Alphaproteobacteria bacterium]
MGRSEPMDVTQDTLLNGAISLRQLKDGFRVAIDTIFLAAAVPVRKGQRIFEPGAGVGGAALCLAHRVAGLRITGIEKNSELVTLAGDNIRANGMAGVVEIMGGDISAPLPPRIAPPFDHVMMNPPYLEAGRGNAPPDEGRAAANIEDEAGLLPWIDCAHRFLGHKATLTLIHRADRLDDLLAALAPRFGDVGVFPLWPKSGMAARRVIIRARKGVASPLRILPGLVLHEADGSYTADAANVLSGGALEI